MTTRLQQVLPNAISVLRVLLVPGWLFTAERAVRDPDSSVVWAPLGILLAIGISDVVDGFLARRWGVMSRAGATLDAVADKLAQVAVITWLALREQEVFTAVPIWFLALLIARDVALGGGVLLLRSRLRGRSVEVVHRWHGKLSSVLLFVVMVWCSASLEPVASLEPALFGGLAALIVVSTWLYLRDGARQR